MVASEIMLYRVNRPCSQDPLLMLRQRPKSNANSRVVSKYLKAFAMVTVAAAAVRIQVHTHTNHTVKK